MTKKADAFPVLRCEEWQCRYVFPNRLCCVLSIGHEGEHQTTCGHGWHFGDRCTEARIVARDSEVKDMTSTPQQELHEGDPIWYRQVMPGGYGFGSDVPGVFVKFTARRAKVRVFTKAGTQVAISVATHNVRRRDPEAVWK